MSIHFHRHQRPLVAVLALSVCIGVAACGGSSSKTTASSNAAATQNAQGAAGGPTGSSGPTGSFAGRFAALRECLQKNGVTLPQRPSGQGGAFGGGGFPGAGGGPRLPSGVSREKLEAAMKKCGGPARFGRFGHFGSARLRSPAYTQALAKFATCMREAGVNVPPPNTTGNGPVFDTKGINTQSQSFRTALAKCRSILRSSFAPPAGATGAPPPTG